MEWEPEWTETVDEIINDTKEELVRFASGAYGQSYVEVTEEDIKALREGKVWGLYDGEYTTVIRLKKEEN